MSIFCLGLALGRLYCIWLVGIIDGCMGWVGKRWFMRDIDTSVFGLKRMRSAMNITLSMKILGREDDFQER